MKEKDVIIRLEENKDHREVESLVRESFFDVYRPGSLEHYVLHCMRRDSRFVRDLDFVMEKDGRIIAQNCFYETELVCDDGRVLGILTMGPICVRRDLQRKGYGKLLLDHCLEKARQMGYKAVMFEGNIAFYSKCGFTYARDFNIRYHGLEEGDDDSFFLCQELEKGYLNEVSAVYHTPECFFVCDRDPEGFAAFEKTFL